jgi:hypothetical protein
MRPQREAKRAGTGIAPFARSAKATSHGNMAGAAVMVAFLRCGDCDWCVCSKERTHYICALNKQRLEKDARNAPCPTDEWSNKWRNYHKNRG